MMGIIEALLIQNLSRIRGQRKIYAKNKYTAKVIELGQELRNHTSCAVSTINKFTLTQARRVLVDFLM